MTRSRTWPWMELGLLGEHQAANAAVAVACVERLRQQGWHISDQAVASGLALCAGRPVWRSSANDHW